MYVLWVLIYWTIDRNRIRTIYGPFKCILSDEKNKMLKVIE